MLTTLITGILQRVPAEELALLKMFTDGEVGRRLAAAIDEINDRDEADEDTAPEERLSSLEEEDRVD